MEMILIKPQFSAPLRILLSVSGLVVARAALVHSAVPTFRPNEDPHTTQTQLILRAAGKSVLHAPLQAAKVPRRIRENREYARTASGWDFREVKGPQLVFAQENTFSFINSIPDFQEVVPKTFGFCGGMTEVLREVSFLAFFDLKNRTGAQIPDPQADPQRYIRFYLQKFERMRRGEVQVIPGFADLFQLSSHPLLKKPLQYYVAQRWAEEALKVSGLEIFSKAQRPMEPEAREAILKRIFDQVGRGELPKLLFSAFSPRPIGGKRIHVVSIWKVEELADGTRRLYAWETNFHYAEIQDRLPYIEVRPDGSLFYQPWYDDHVASGQSPLHPQAGQVAQLALSRETEREAVNAWSALNSFCSQPENQVICGI